MKKIYISIACILCLLLCACSSKTVVNGCEITVEPCAWSYENGKETMNAIAGEIGEESDAWNKYYPYVHFTKNKDNVYRYMIFDNNRVAVIYNWPQSSGKIINVKDFYPDQFKSVSDEITLYKHGLRIDISKNERYTIMSSAGLPIYVFDNENGTAKKITLSKPKFAFLIGDSLYICFADIDRYLGEATEYPDSVIAKDYTTSVLYDLQSGKIEQTQFTERKKEQEPPDLNEYTNIGDISSHIDSFVWDGTISKDVITELNNTDPYKVQLYLYNTTDKTYCTQVINVFDLVQ